MKKEDALDDAHTTKRLKNRGGRAFHSRLEPHVGFIREQRQKRKTWKEIADLLRTEKGCAIPLQGVHQFYRRDVKRATRPHWEDATLTPVTTPNAAAETDRKLSLAATPPNREFRRPNPADITIHDHTKR